MCNKAPRRKQRGIEPVEIKTSLDSQEASTSLRHRSGMRSIETDA